MERKAEFQRSLLILKRSTGRFSNNKIFLWLTSVKEVSLSWFKTEREGDKDIFDEMSHSFINKFDFRAGQIGQT